MKFFWCRDPFVAEKAAEVFCDNLTESYISHSELQSYRALAPGAWSPDIREIIAEDIRLRIKATDIPAAGQCTQLAAALEENERIIGVFLVTFSHNSAVPFCVLEDIVIEKASRGKGYGSAFLHWITSECQQRGIYRLFLESGIENHRAHDLFHKAGFRSISVVMIKDLPSSRER